MNEATCNITGRCEGLGMNEATCNVTGRCEGLGTRLHVM